MAQNINLKVREYKDGALAWQEAGSGEVIVFLHAMAGSATAFQPQFDFFKKDYRCIAWDMPGFGMSKPLPDDASMEDVVACLKHFVTNSLNVERVHFVGISVGGMILQKFAVAHADLVHSITILDSSPKFGIGGTMKPAEFVDPILKDFSNGKTVVDFSDGMVRAIVGPKCSETVKLEAITSMARATVSGLKLTTRLIGDHDALADLANIKAPALVLVGRDDGDTPPEYSARIAQDIPNAQLVVIDDAGHLSNLENPDAVNNALSSFLNNLKTKK